MAVADTGKWRGDGTFALPTSEDSWEGVEFADPVGSPAAIYTQDGNDIDIEIGETGWYLAIYRIRTSSNSDNRNIHRVRALYNSSVIEGSQGTGWFRHDENDEVVAENFNLLIGASTLSVYDLVSKINDLDGLCIASHIDRPAFGIISNLGFIPEDLQFSALEVSWRISVNEAAASIPGIGRFSCITSSDAHYIEDVGKIWTGFMLDAPTFDEVRMGLSGQAGRKIVHRETVGKEGA